MSNHPRPPHQRCPWFWSGLALGLAFGIAATAPAHSPTNRPPSTLPSHASRSLSTFPGP